MEEVVVDEESNEECICGNILNSDEETERGICDECYE